MRKSSRSARPSTSSMAWPHVGPTLVVVISLLMGGSFRAGPVGAVPGLGVHRLPDARAPAKHTTTSSWAPMKISAPASRAPAPATPRIGRPAWTYNPQASGSNTHFTRHDRPARAIHSGTDRSFGRGTYRPGLRRRMRPERRRCAPEPRRSATTLRQARSLRRPPGPGSSVCPASG
jgi:hypothetical protein